MALIHRASVTPANMHDLNPYLDCHEVPNLLHGNETRFYGDSAYRGKEQRERLKVIAPKAKDFLNPFLTLKRLWGFAKTRYRGLEKNANRAFVQKRIQTMLAMINLVQVGKAADGTGAPSVSEMPENLPFCA